MPTRIPVQIEHHYFPSINQARIHYRDILHRYQPGQQVNEDDREQVVNLMMESSFPYPPTTAPIICVVKSRYGRTCFASIGKDKLPHSVSIMHSLKQCAHTTTQQSTDQSIDIRLGQSSRNVKS
ncbi:hypothetical protein [Hydrogenophaga sp. NH-16]|uniref:hypothetical protein n=1 Tax=Hydrogenophaga sp. NH-16 TaxID=2184519 RepID=UPI000FD99F20|nr:hypothetical protein [Hydrogenophaga sp. NH-16]